MAPTKSSSSSKTRYNVPIKPYHLTLASFFLVLVVVWALLITFQFTFLYSSSDFITDFFIPGIIGDGSLSKANRVLSDKGRMTTFLWTLLITVVITAALHFGVFTRM